MITSVGCDHWIRRTREHDGLFAIQNHDRKALLNPSRIPHQAVLPKKDDRWLTTPS